MHDLIGQSLGRYHILEQLGEGGMATVFKAYDIRLERDVAVKVIRRGAFPPDQLERIIKRFEREAKALARLNHSNIVKVTDYGEHEGAPYLVMPYLPGGTLKKYIKGHGQVPWQEAIKILLPIAEALHYAQSQNIIHRDVKPSNIILTEGGQPMLTDFGVAKLFDLEETAELTGTGVGVGTPEYMAPEQFQGKNIDSRADVYSLGVVLFELLTGRKPYSADTPAAVIIKQATEPLPRPTQIVPDLPIRLEEVLFKALAKDINNRYASMDEFAIALEAVLQAPTPRRWRIPRLLRYGKAGGIILGIVLVVGLAGWLTGKPAAIFSTHTLTLIPTLTVYLTPTSTFTPVFTASPTASPTPLFNVGSSWTRPSDGMVMVYVPEGDFIMGSDIGNPDEQPVHTVYLDAFWIDRTEVTYAEYAKCVEAGVCQQEENNGGLRPSVWNGGSGFENFPVASSSWVEAQTYCVWTGGRLPTEAEWEKAARGPNGRIYPWGDGLGCMHANYYGTYGCVGTGQSQYNEVATHIGASLYGALDQAGNVMEWVADWYSEKYYSQSPDRNPQGPVYGDERVMRGGSAYSNASDVRSSRRYSASPLNSGSGFRCARSTIP
jgi:eukaryotic-like serine/threonine-protein kinase